jgi:PAS domain S-box-containing protein
MQEYGSLPIRTVMAGDMIATDPTEARSREQAAGATALRLLGSFDVSDTLQAVAESARAALGAARATCYVISDDRVVSSVYTTESDPRARAFLERTVGMGPAEVPIWRYQLAQADPLIVVEDVSTDPDLPEALVARLRAGAFLGIRVEHPSVLGEDGRPALLGTLFCTYREPRLIGSAEREAARGLAALTALALANARLRAEALSALDENRIRARQQEALRRVATEVAAVAAGAAADELFAVVAAEAASLCGAERALVLRPGGDRTTLGQALVVAVRSGDRPWGEIVVWCDPDQVPAAVQAILAQMAELVAVAIASAEAREALRTSERRFRALATHAPVGIFEVAPGGECRFVNERWSDLTGLSAPEAAVLGWAGAVHPEDRRGVIELWRKRVAEGGEFAAEFRCSSVDGRVSWVAGRAVALRDEAGAITGYLGTIADFSERKHAEEELRRQASVIRAVIEGVPAAISLVDRTGKLLLSNAEMDRWDNERGNPPGQTVMERALASASLTSDPAAYRAGVKALAADPRLQALDRYQLAASGRCFERYSAPVHDHGGELLGRLFVLREVTAEERAKQASDEFVALASHELRTPLTSILGYLEAVLDGEAGELGSEQRRFLGTVDRNARRLLRLVDDLLLVARAEAGRLGLQPERIDLGQLAAECVQGAGPEAEDRGIALTLEADLVPVYGDRRRLCEVMDNLISNALKFTPRDGRVALRASSRRGQALLEVADSGIGIPAAEQGRLFERFYRTSAAEAAAIPGTGLGLAISKMIVEAHGGRMEVESEAGAGATFRVRLPVAV